MKFRILVIAVIATIQVGVPANASVLKWTLKDVHFSDGALASGAFTTDTTSGQLLSYNILTTSGLSGSGFHYNVADSYIGINNPLYLNSFVIIANSSPGSLGVRDLELVFQSPLSVRGTDLLRSLFSNENLAPGTRSITTGSASTVPEPSSWGMLLIGFGVVGWLRRRQVRLAVASA